MMDRRAAVVTGAGHGIGRAVSTMLARSAWQVVGVDVRAADIESLATAERGVVPIVGDVADDNTLRAARRRAESVGGLTAWVNNAALPGLGRLHETGMADARRTIGVNLVSVFAGCREAVASYMENSVPGAIVNISSIHARASFPGFAAYDMCKGGVEALTRYVCVEYGHLGIRCNAVAPGVVDTPFVGQADERRREELRGYSPMGSVIPPADIAGTVAFLLSDSARYVNGHVLAVDGGMAARCLARPATEAG